MADTPVAQTPSTTTYTTPSGANVTLNSDQSVNSLQDADGSTIPQPTGQSLIVTSGASRAQYANNVTSMNTALAAKTPTPTTNAGSTGANVSNEGKPGYDVFGQPVDTSGVQTARINGGTYQGMDGNSYYKYDGTPADNAPTPVGSNTSSGGGSSGDGTSDGTSTGGINTTGMDPAVVKQYNDVITQSDQVLQQRQADLTAAKATVANDPAASAALDSIKSQYDVLIKAMQAKNQMLLGGYQVGQARSGAMQFANEMSSNFMSSEMDAANGRIGDLIAKENDLLLKTTIAYKTGDVKALNAAQAAYDKANTDKLKAIGDLVKATNDHVKQVQAQAKIDAAAVKQATTLDISKSTNLGKSIADRIAQSGITDPAQIDAYIKQVAQSSGITDPEILRSAVTKAQQDQTKLDSSTANTADTIKNRDAGTAIKQQNANKKKSTPTPKGGTDGAYNYTADDIATYTNLMNKGGVAPDGTKFNGRGSDSFVDPGTYLAAYTDWVKNGGTPAGFAKKFPVASNVNPASYSQLPQGLQPKAKTTTSTTPPLPTN